MGIATQIPSRDRTSEELIGEADQALYQAKQQGRDCWIHFNVISQDTSSSFNITDNCQTYDAIAEIPKSL